MEGEEFAARGGWKRQWSRVLLENIEALGDRPDQPCELPAGGEEADGLTEDRGGEANCDIASEHGDRVDGKEGPLRGVEEDAADEGGDEGEDAELAAGFGELTIEALLEVFLLHDREAGEGKGDPGAAAEPEGSLE